MVLTGVFGEEEDFVTAPGKWSIRQIVAHLADADLVGAHRFRQLIAEENPTLVAFDQESVDEEPGLRPPQAQAVARDFPPHPRRKLRAPEGTSALRVRSRRQSHRARPHHPRPKCWKAMPATPNPTPARCRRSATLTNGQGQKVVRRPGAARAGIQSRASVTLEAMPENYAPLQVPKRLLFRTWPRPGIAARIPGDVPDRSRSSRSLLFSD